MDDRHTCFETKAPLLVQVIKLALGFALVMAIKGGLKPVLGALMNGSPVAHAIRYFVMVIVGAGLWPMTFRFFVKLGKN